MTDANSKAETYKYNLAGNLADILNRNGNETIMTYDLRNGILSRSVPITGDSMSYSYGYNHYS